MVTVVDASNLLRDYASRDFLNDRGERQNEEHQHTLADLLAQQIEFADVIVLNKADLASARQLGTVRKFVRSLNPEARIIEARFGDVPLDAILDTEAFDIEKAQQRPLWAKELYGFKDHIPETEEYGVSSFVYHARAPFHPARFYEFVGSSWQGVVRAKGFFWLATRPAHVGELSQVGPVVRTSPLGFWWDAVARQDWPQSPESLASLRARWHRAYGDRRQQIVFIGIDIDKSDLCRRLDDCLIGSDDDEAVDFEALSLLPDPFPIWSSTCRDEHITVAGTDRNLPAMANAFWDRDWA